jgi:hypothetical protein
LVINKASCRASHIFIWFWVMTTWKSKRRPIIDLPVIASFILHVWVFILKGLLWTILVIVVVVFHLSL